jgi:uncharacterized delta-60 repeat protein
MRTFILILIVISACNKNAKTPTTATSGGGDTIPPDISITSPTDGSTVNATVTIKTTATDNIGVVGVQFRIDGANYGAEVTTPPYNIQWDTKTYQNRSHNLTAIARDAAGNTEMSTSIAVIVNNSTSFLDSTFANQGIYQDSLTFFKDIKTSASGAIVAAGSANLTRYMAVNRFTNSGALDPTFGPSGPVWFQTYTTYNVSYATAIQPDDKILVAGYTAGQPAGTFLTNGVLARLNSDGTLDSSFGINGKAIFNLNGYEKFLATAMQPDGKIIVVGFTDQTNRNELMVVIRYNANGTIDATFGTAGILLIDLDLRANYQDALFSVKLFSNGKILVVGSSAMKATAIKLTSTGQFDATFGTNGIVSDTSGKLWSFNDATIAADEKITLTGDYHNLITGQWDTFVTRLLPNGASDTSFGTNGTLVLVDPEGVSMGIYLQQQLNGSYYGAYNVQYTPGRYKTVLTHIQSNGALDSSFGNNGRIKTELEVTDIRFFGFAATPSGILVSGNLQDASSNLIPTLLRYHY